MNTVVEKLMRGAKLYAPIGFDYKGVLGMRHLSHDTVFGYSNLYQTEEIHLLLDVVEPQVINVEDGIYHLISSPETDVRNSFLNLLKEIKLEYGKIRMQFMYKDVARYTGPASERENYVTGAVINHYVLVIDIEPPIADIAIDCAVTSHD